MVTLTLAFRQELPEPIHCLKHLIMIDKAAIDTNALKYCSALKRARFSAFLVGGSVRDLLLGKKPKDFDIATNATPMQIKRTIPNGKIIGRRFRHVMLDQDNRRYEIITFRGAVINRTENAKGNKPAYPDLNQFGNAEQDAVRRDFTINALFYDPDSNELVDYVGGKKDIDAKILRAIGSAPVRMKEDPIRILRAIRHKVKLNLKYNPPLEKAMKAMAPELESTSRDRVREEFLKICNDRSLSAFLEEAKRINILQYVAPWFKDIHKNDWEDGVQAWRAFATEKEDPPTPIIGLSMMAIPLVQSMVVEEFKKEANRDIRFDVKYFLHSDPLRSCLMRSLRLSRVQADLILRICFYWHQMTNTWLDQDPLPSKVSEKLQQRSAPILAALVAKIWIQARGKEVPSWMNELASSAYKKMDAPRSTTRKRPSSVDKSSRRKYRRDEENLIPAVQALPPLDKPLTWNGPLHQPIMRPIFPEDTSVKSSKVSPYRESGIPLIPTDKSIIHSYVIQNYKPEFPNEPEDKTESRQEVSTENHLNESPQKNYSEEESTVVQENSKVTQSRK